MSVESSAPPAADAAQQDEQERQSLTGHQLALADPDAALGERAGCDISRQPARTEIMDLPPKPEPDRCDGHGALEDKTDALSARCYPLSVSQPAHVDAVQQVRTLRGRVEQPEHVQERGLSGAGRSHDSHERTALDDLGRRAEARTGGAAPDTSGRPAAVRSPVAVHGS